MKNNNILKAKLMRVWLVSIALIFLTIGARAQVYDTTLNTAQTAVKAVRATHKITLDVGFSADGTVAKFGATIVPLPLYSCGALGTPSSAQNYVATYTMRVPVTDTANIKLHTICEVNQAIQYFDALGRPVQTVQVKANPDGTKDVVQPTAYDAYGREITKYLPYTTSAGTSGGYRADALTGTSGYSNSAQYSFYQTTGQNYSTNTSPYAVTLLENSPMDRPFEHGAPGDVWQPSSSRTTTAGRTEVSEYAGNASSEVLLWVVNSSGARADTNHYAAGTLEKTVTKDENWTSGKRGTIEQFTDFKKHVLLKRVWENETSSLSTYYVYDYQDNLRYVIPPAVSATTFIESDAVFKNFIYGYHYDERQRLVQKKIPGRGWYYTVYNTLDQIVAMQDSNQRSKSQWIVIKYDNQGRTIVKGIWNSNISQAALKTNVYTQTVNWEHKDNTQTCGYTLSNTYPTTVDTVLSVSYYDNYDIANLPATYDQHTANSAMTKGLATANLTNVLGSTNMLWAVNYYDEKGRVVHSYDQHYLDGSVHFSANNYDMISNMYNFNYSLAATNRQHYNYHSTTSTLTIANNYFYDHVGRKRQSFEKINSGDSTMIVQNDFNEIGQEYKKHLHSQDGGVTFLQNVAYAYNERGWVTTTTAPLFATQLKYNDGTVPQYNGNISNQLWGTPGTLGSTYTYVYDALNRLTKGTANTGNDEKSISYDAMGNITGLQRYLTSTKVDGLSYSYVGNQMQSVTDSTSNDGGYKHGAHSYAYDGNGNMTSDGSKGISGLSVTYNTLNLPSENALSGNTVTYIYSASGQKLRKVSTFGSGTSTEYISGIQYTNGTIDFVQTEEGRALNGGGDYYNYEYNLVDHLGNTRLSFDSHGSTIQQTDYLPFGLEATVGSILSPKNEYLYNRKELQEELGQYDYGARFYDPVVGRWTAVDPLAELSRRWSTYNYGENNPIRNIDLDGMSTESWMKDNGVTSDDVITIYQATPDEQTEEEQQNSDGKSTELPGVTIVAKGDHTATPNKRKPSGKPFFTIKRFLEYIRKGGSLYSLGGKLVKKGTLVAGLTTFVDMIANRENEEKVKEDMYDFLKDFALDTFFEFGKTENPIGIATALYDFMQSNYIGQEKLMIAAGEEYRFSLNEWNLAQNAADYDYWRTRTKAASAQIEHWWKKMHEIDYGDEE